ncbi:HI0074 family nucleotidyltransferase substrate-binding subunit [Jeongeupia sp. HS-3]|uniref:HI0074 family nucleotidyltransferase substrate-binding subunit n=1 Tax=Jeongeupia sp. HS-3 TaxID=1009682 RepID=UPI0019110F1B|nr:HI0074 family nucleotidyltransferase substrate-binding subunit [Jeongeupia sp. HS-3]
MTIPLDLTSLASAIDRLAEALDAIHAEPENLLYRDATIQRFEFTYEIAHKMLRRYLAQAAANPEEIHEMAFADLIRAGNAQGLLQGDWPRWREFRQARGTTSHTYDEAKAKQVLILIPDFLAEARGLLLALQARTVATP